MSIHKTSIPKNKTKSTYNIVQNCLFMLSVAWKNRCSLIWLIFAIAIVTVLLNFVQLFVTPVILNTIESGIAVSRLFIIIVLLAGALILLNAAVSYLSSCTLFKRIEVRLCIAAMIQDKILTMSYPNIDNQEVRKKMDKAFMLVNNTTAATEAIWNTLTNLFKNIVGFGIYLSLLATLHPLFIAIICITTVASFFISNYVNGWGYRHRDEEAEYSRRMNYLSERSRDYTLAKDIRIFGMVDWIEDVYDSTLRLFQNFAARSERVYLLGNLADVIFAFMRNGIVYLFLINAVLKGELFASQFVLYLNAVGAFASGIGGILAELSILNKQSLDISAVREFLDYPETFLFEEGIPLIPSEKGNYQIQLKNVSFRYPGAQKDTLTHINLTIRSGEKLAIVGLNGAGKTTLIKLICGFLDPTNGEVLLNNKNIKMYNRRTYYQLFSAVFQDFSLLDVTIGENITQTDEIIDSEKVRYCLEQAGLLDKINNLPNGVNTHLGKVYEDGVELSGGETQRLMLARALYKNAPIIVLDEPTAALDPIAESDIYNKYSQLTDGRTSVYISHRLASTRFCDRIIMLADGVIIEEGTHDELIAKDCRYAELFEIQSCYYREGVMDSEKE